MKAQIIAIALLCGLASSCTNEASSFQLQAENDALKREITAIRVAMSTAAWYLNQQAGIEEMQISAYAGSKHEPSGTTSIILTLDDKRIILMVRKNDLAPIPLQVYEEVFKRDKDNPANLLFVDKLLHPEWTTNKDWRR